MTEKEFPVGVIGRSHVMHIIGMERNDVRYTDCGLPDVRHIGNLAPSQVENKCKRCW